MPQQLPGRPRCGWELVRHQEIELNSFARSSRRDRMKLKELREERLGEGTHDSEGMPKESPESLRQAKFRRVFYVPGNHELWLNPAEASKYPDSLAKLLGIMETCDEPGALKHLNLNKYNQHNQLYVSHRSLFQKEAAFSLPLGWGWTASLLLSVRTELGLF